MSVIKRYFGIVKRFVVLILLLAITFSYAMFQGGFVSWFLFFTLIPFLVYSLLLAVVPLRFTEVRREILPTRVFGGNTASVEVSFRNKSWFPLLFLAVKEMDMDDSFYEKTKGESSNIFFVGWKRRFEWTYEISNVERGEIEYKGLQLTITDMFGWTIRQKVIDKRQTIVVYPNIIDMTFKKVQLQSNRGGIQSPYSLIKDISAVSGIREYQSGDRSSWIHWKSFAKNETLRTKEFENSQTKELFLVLDKTSAVNFERAVELVASIVQAIIRKRGDFSFLSYGEDRSYFPKIKSQVQLEKVMHHLAVVKPETQEMERINLINELSFINSSTLIVVTGALTEPLKNSLVHSTRVTRSAICFVVVDNKPLKNTDNPSKIPGVKIIYLTKEMFPNVFTEVLKP